MIEELESHLHPKWQKLIPKILHDLGNELNIKFILTNHSPIIISAAASLPDQKVYLIEDGQTKDAESGELNTDRSELGYSGFDSQIYSEIFINKSDFTFISSGSEQHLGNNSYVAKKIAKSIFKNGIVFALKDGDGKKMQQQQHEKTEFKNKFEFDLKFLGKYSIESYLFNHDIVSKTYNIDSQEYIKLTAELNIDNQTSDHCKILKKYTRDKIGNQNLSEKNMCLALARTITELSLVVKDPKNPNIYWQLHDCIFSE